MVSRKSMPNGNIYDKDRPYINLTQREDAATKREDFSNLTDPELEKHWREIFDSPEINREFKAEDFKDMPPVPHKSEFSNNQEDEKERPSAISSLLTGTFSSKLKIMREAIDEM